MIRARHSAVTVTVHRHDLLDLLSYALEGSRPPGDLYMRLRNAVAASLDAEPRPLPLLAVNTTDWVCAACGQPAAAKPYGIELPSGRLTHDECAEVTP
jgi:hypothetical protein